MWIPFEPKVGRYRTEFLSFARKVIEPEGSASISKLRESLKEGKPASTDRVKLRLAESFLLDLVEQGWELSIGDALSVRPPETRDETPATAKNRIRKGHLIERNSQLRQKPVREFLQSMEQRRLTRNGWHSIYSLMRDGRDLARRLEETLRGTSDSSDHLANVVSPYLQFVDTDAVCEFTGLRLADVWRYFRLTWVNAYKSVPGRSIMVLVRDSAVENHPVIGIASLGSSVVQQEIRDRWIGWTADEFLAKLEEEPTARSGRWLLDGLASLIDGIYLDDLIADGILTKDDIMCPSTNVIDRLRQEAESARNQHHLYPRASSHKTRTENGKIRWDKEACSDLFRSKRCDMLSKLLSIRTTFDELGLIHGTSREIQMVLYSARARAAISQVVRMIKAEHVGIDMMDITVCGAIAPYNHLLGGKLVCLLLMSPEVITYYKNRYGEQESVIASSMKGSPVRRTPRLVFLGTTSLYGIGSSQYNRLKVSCEEVGGEVGDKLEYRRLGLSKGFGSFHFSAVTIEFVNIVLARRIDGRRVNSIFGEGVNPLMRKLREALEELELPSDRVLNHGNPRVIYGVALARNFREVLLGRVDKPKYLIPVRTGRNGSRKLATYWRKRWLAPRIRNENILAAVARHTLAYPVTHGARVSDYITEAEIGESLKIWGDCDN